MRVVLSRAAFLVFPLEVGWMVCWLDGWWVCINNVLLLMHTEECQDGDKYS